MESMSFSFQIGVFILWWYRTTVVTRQFGLLKSPDEKPAFRYRQVSYDNLVQPQGEKHKHIWASHVGLHYSQNCSPPCFAIRGLEAHAPRTCDYVALK